MNTTSVDKQLITVYSNDKSISELKSPQSFFTQLWEGSLGKEFVGCAIVFENNPEFNGCYFGVFKSHSSLKSNIHNDKGILLPHDVDAFSTRGCIHGFYTENGYFLNRLQAADFANYNNLKLNNQPTVFSTKGLTSEDIWGDVYVKPIRPNKQKFPTTTELMQAKRKHKYRH